VIGFPAGRRGTSERPDDRTGCPPGFCLVSADQRPSDIRDYTGVRDTPLVLAVALALLAIATLTHVLLTSIRHRRRDLAMFKTLGLLRHRCSAWCCGKHAR